VKLRHAWIVYLISAVSAEVVLPFAPVASALIDAVVLVTALTHFGWAQRFPLAIGDPPTRLLPAVTLLPLLRLLSLTMPVPELAPAAWLVLVGAPLLLAIWAAGRLVNIDVKEVGLVHVSRDWQTAVVVALSAPAGLLLARLGDQPLWSTTDSPLATFGVAVAAVGFAAIPEELAFRGVLQPLLGSVIGRMAIVLTALVYAVTYVGTGSVWVVMLMAGVGLAYGREMDRTDALWGPIIGHGLLITTALFVAPVLFPA